MDYSTFSNPVLQSLCQCVYNVYIVYIVYFLFQRGNSFRFQTPFILVTEDVHCEGLLLKSSLMGLFSFLISV